MEYTFNFMCCPKKPKYSLDYIINWIDDIKTDDLKSIFDDYAENYDWSSIQEFSELQQQIDALETSVASKVAKVIPSNVGNIATLSASGNIVDSEVSISDVLKKLASVTAGHLVSLNADGSISDSGIATSNVVTDISGKMDKVASPTNGNLAALNASGEVIDSNVSISELAPSAHTHSSLTADSGHTTVNLGNGELHLMADEGTIVFDVGQSPAPVELSGTNLNNFRRALQDPDEYPIISSDNPITSGAVAAAQMYKLDKSTDIVGTIDNNTYVSIDTGVTKTFIEEHSSGTTIVALFGVYDSSEDDLVNYNAFVKFKLSSLTDGKISVQIGTEIFTHNYTVSGSTVYFDDTVAWTREGLL